MHGIRRKKYSLRFFFFKFWVQLWVWIVLVGRTARNRHESERTAPGCSYFLALILWLRMCELEDWQALWVMNCIHTTATIIFEGQCTGQGSYTLQIVVMSVWLHCLTLLNCSQRWNGLHIPAWHFTLQDNKGPTQTVLTDCNKQNK